jgi:hypothetical protein
LLAAKCKAAAEQPLKNNEEEAFIAEYLRNGMNGTAAWIFVHPGMPPDRAAHWAYRMVRKGQVARRL